MSNSIDILIQLNSTSMLKFYQRDANAGVWKSSANNKSHPIKANPFCRVIPSNHVRFDAQNAFILRPDTTYYYTLIANTENPIIDMPKDAYNCEIVMSINMVTTFNQAVQKDQWSQVVKDVGDSSNDPIHVDVYGALLIKPTIDTNNVFSFLTQNSKSDIWDNNLTYLINFYVNGLDNNPKFVQIDPLIANTSDTVNPPPS